MNNNLCFEEKITIIIDSNKRNINLYPNPFKFKIFFEPIYDQSNFYINRNFKNIKSFFINKIYLPNQFNINIEYPDILPNEELLTNSNIFNSVENNYIENKVIIVDNINYVLINAYKIIFDKIDFSIQINNNTY
jgi:hypothetical protein